MPTLNDCLFRWNEDSNISYKGEKDLIIVMEEDSQEMDEVVVTGYQVVDRRKNTSAVNSFNMDELMIPGTSSIPDAARTSTRHDGHE